MKQPNETPCAAARRVIERIEAEHRALARVIAAMQAWVVQGREPRATRDLELFETMLRYVEEVPDRFHHPQEDGILFPAVRLVAGGARIVERLERDHEAGAPMLGLLHEALKALRAGAPNAYNRLASAVDEFAEFYWAHMREEERSLLPLAAAALGPAEWERIDGAFAAMGDPLASPSASAEYSRLYRYIAARTQEPMRGYLEAITIDGGPASR